MKFKELVESNNTGLDAIKRAPIVDYNTGIKCLRIGDISQSKNFKDWGYTKVEENNYEKFCLKKGDIIIARTGATVGANKYIENDLKAVFNNGLIRIKIKKEVNSLYAYYLLQTQIFKDYINGISKGTSAQPNMQMNDLLSFQIPNIDKINQNKIVKMLSDIDKKIELNNKINNNLYDIGLSLLNNYFSDVSDKVLLNKVIIFVKGKKPKNILHLKEKNYLKYLTIAGLNGQELNYADTEKMLIANQDLLMVMDGASSGDIYYSDYGIVGSTLSRLDIIDEKYIKEYIFFCLKKYNALIKSKNTGSAIPHTDKVFVGSLEIPKLDKNKQMQFKVLLEKVQDNLKENETLIQLRDTLLPKLVNGEIDLENIEI